MKISRIKHSILASLFALITILAVAAQGNFSHHTFTNTAQEQAPCADTINQDAIAAAIDSVIAAEMSDSIFEIQLPWPQNICADIDQLLQSPMFLRSQVGIMVFDLDGDSVLYDHCSLQLMRPASVMKLVTSCTALNNLGKDHKFRTQLYYTGEVQDSVLNGDIYIKGGFDPLFDIYDLNAFVEAIKEKQIYDIQGHIYADVSFKDTLKWGEGWCWDDKEATLTPLLYDAKDIFMDQFLKKLTTEGIKHPVNYTRKRTNGNNLTLLSERTHTISQMLPHMMKASDNLYAESLFYQLGSSDNKPYASGRNSAEKEYQFIRSLGLSPDDYSVADGSGLSLYNYLTPHMVVRLLRYAWHTPAIYDTLYPSLPIAGVDGTLKNRMKGTKAQSNIHAKTGTVRKVSTLAGYATASNGNRLAFAIFNQGILNSTEGRDFQDKVCNAIVQ